MEQHTGYSLCTDSPSIWPEDSVWGLLDQLTFKISSIAQLYCLCLPSRLVFILLSPLQTLCPFLFLAVYLSRRHLWNDLLMDDINTVITVLYIYTWSCVFIDIWAMAYISLHVCACQLVSVHAFESCFHLVPRSSLLMRLSVEIIGRLSPQVQPWHCLGKNPNPASRWMCDSDFLGALKCTCGSPFDPKVHALHHILRLKLT